MLEPTLAAAAAVLTCLGAETLGHPLGAVDRRPVVLVARAAAILMLVLIWFSITWRPLLACAAASITVAVLRGISEKKRRLVGEPLAFSDFALLKQVVRFPDLYYLDARAFLVVAVAAIPVEVWFWAEPAQLPDRAGAALVALPLVLAAVARWSLRPFATLAVRLAEPIGSGPSALVVALARDEARLGLLLSLLVRLSRWWDRCRAPPPRPRRAVVAPLAPPPRTVVIVQLESFVDPADVPGASAAPNLARVRRGALFQGALGVPSHGAYTMRSEFAVLSGLDPAEIGEEGLDPYLSAAGRGFETLATALRARGHRTVFIHPFRRGFFGRDRVMASLGFADIVMEDGFSGAERVGAYVSDVAVARRILDEIDRRPGPTLVFAVTMQNHGPWRTELDPAAGTPIARYRRHLADADRLIGILLDGLEARGEFALLCLYGDHPPILDEVGPPTQTPATTYAVVAVGGPGRGERHDMSVAGLGRLLRALAGG